MFRLDVPDGQYEKRSLGRRLLFDGFRQKRLRRSVILSDPDGLPLTVRSRKVYGDLLGRQFEFGEALEAAPEVGVCSEALALIGHRVTNVTSVGDDCGGSVCELCGISPAGELAPVSIGALFMPQFRALYRHAVMKLSVSTLVAAVRPEDVNYFEGVLCFRRTARCLRDLAGMDALCLELDLTKSGTTFLELYAGTPAHRNIYLYLHADLDEESWVIQPACGDEWCLA